MISVSIVSHEQGGLVSELLRSLWEHHADLPVEILITENQPSAPPIEVDGPTSEVTFHRNQRSRGFAANHNRAFDRARGAFFCLLNPDVLFTENVLATLIEDIQSSRGSVVAPLVVDRQGLPQDSFRPLPSPGEMIRRIVLGARVPHAAETGTLVYPDWIAAILLLMRSRTYRELGGLDERYQLYFEDVDFGCRARLAGHQLLVDTRVRIVHDAQRRSRRELRHLWWHLSSMLRFYSSPVYREARRLSEESAAAGR